MDSARSTTPMTGIGNRDNRAMSTCKPCVQTAAILALVLSAASLAACSSRAVYQTVQGWQQQECRKLPDVAERQRCLGSTAASYDDYRRAREAAQGPK
jgi:hypothetical protein